ncbi:MAG: hypothetical protein BGO43_06710 [Gammaproteobacteria bacterium 39-13]|nr:hypothetical protein [Gammaproteobacteria bacterium]OJV90530.1 MAG: hypothetical protein BGO43_06710 [Gammaproteobacteria bacterium 39-13]
MRQLTANELNNIAGGSFEPTILEIIGEALPQAVDTAIGTAIGGAVGLGLRTAIGIESHTLNEVISHSITSAAICGVAYMAGYVGTYVYKDPAILTR